MMASIANSLSSNTEIRLPVKWQNRASDAVLTARTTASGVPSGTSIAPSGVTTAATPRLSTAVDEPLAVAASVVWRPVIDPIPPVVAVLESDVTVGCVLKRVRVFIILRHAPVLAEPLVVPLVSGVVGRLVAALVTASWEPLGAE